MKHSPNAPCPCGRGPKYKQCCQPYHKGKPASTPAALMRSRYSAYALHLVNYIIETTHPDSPHTRSNYADWQTELEQFCAITHFQKLDILSKSEVLPTGQDDEKTGWVTFRATLSQKSQDASFTERSLFKRHQGKWKYLSGEASK